MSKTVKGRNGPEEPVADWKCYEGELRELLDTSPDTFAIYD